jgi:hypothetical protein
MAVFGSIILSHRAWSIGHGVRIERRNRFTHIAYSTSVKVGRILTGKSGSLIDYFDSENR